MRQLAISLNLIIVVLLLATCGPNQRTKTIKTALVTVNEARDAFIVLDAKIQNTIADTAPSVVEGIKRLDEYKLKREPLVTAFEAAYRAIAIAATADDARSVAMMLATVAQIQQLIETLKRFAP